MRCQATQSQYLNKNQLSKTCETINPLLRHTDFTIRFPDNEPAQIQWIRGEALNSMARYFLENDLDPSTIPTCLEIMSKEKNSYTQKTNLGSSIHEVIMACLSLGLDQLNNRHQKIVNQIQYPKRLEKSKIHHNDITISHKQEEENSSDNLYS